LFQQLVSWSLDDKIKQTDPLPLVKERLFGECRLGTLQKAPIFCFTSNARIICFCWPLVGNLLQRQTRTDRFEASVVILERVKLRFETASPSELDPTTMASRDLTVSFLEHRTSYINGVSRKRRNNNRTPTGTCELETAVGI
jgi:hypothetical protein